MAATGTPPPAAAGCNPRVAAGLPGLFGRPELADCCVVFVLEQPTPASAHRPASPRRHQQASAAAAAAVAGPAATSCQRKAGAEDAPPRSAGHQPLTLPAHSVVLSLASERFAAQVSYHGAVLERSSGELWASSALCGMLVWETRGVFCRVRANELNFGADESSDFAIR